MVYLYMTIIPLSRRDNKDASGFQHLGTKCPEVVKAGERQNRSPAGLTLHNTLSTTAISVRGAVRSIGTKRLAEIFEKNPYMAKIYPTEKSREALEVFQLYKGQGEYFDLAQLPPYRQSFSFGGERVQENGYRIIPEKCIGCQGCRSVCPVNCISSTIPRNIDTAHCLHCGNCLSICPVGAVERIGAASQATK